jgi:hypothetical protein
MTIVVTVTVTDGIVMAADSASSFFDGAGHAIKIYNNANKIFNLVKGLPIGAMLYGAGSMGTSSIETLTKGLRRRMSDPNDADYGLDPLNYTIEEVAQKARRFLFEECYPAAFPNPDPDFYMGYRVGGYSVGEPLAEGWEFVIGGAHCAAPHVVQDKGTFGPRWAGQNEALDRLLLGVPGNLVQVLTSHGVSQADADAWYLEVAQGSAAPVTMAAMPIQDAVDVARFLVETASKFARYRMTPETIGGPIEVAAITKYEGFKWISRKHYYNDELNPETNHA